MLTRDHRAGPAHRRGRRARPDRHPGRDRARVAPGPAPPPTAGPAPPPPSARPRCTPPRRPSATPPTSSPPSTSVRRASRSTTRAAGSMRASARLVQYAELGPCTAPCTALGRHRLHGPGPRGVVAVLAPWNDPSPSPRACSRRAGHRQHRRPQAQRAAARHRRRFAELLAAHLPEGVLEILDGDGSVGRSSPGPTSTSSRTSAARDRPRSRSMRPTCARRCWRTAATTR